MFSVNVLNRCVQIFPKTVHLVNKMRSNVYPHKWFFRPVVNSSCGLFVLWLIRHVVNSSCGLFIMVFIRHVVYSSCDLFVLWFIRPVVYSSCG